MKFSFVGDSWAGTNKVKDSFLLFLELDLELGFLTWFLFLFVLSSHLAIFILPRTKTSLEEFRKFHSYLEAMVILRELTFLDLAGTIFSHLRDGKILLEIIAQSGFIGMLRNTIYDEGSAWGESLHLMSLPSLLVHSE